MKYKNTKTTITLLTLAIFAALSATGCEQDERSNVTAGLVPVHVHSEYNDDKDLSLRHNSDDLFRMDLGTEKVNKSTGAILDCFERYENGDIIRDEWAGNKYRATCGATFISPNHAITAEHCIDACAGDGHEFVIRQYDISEMTRGHFINAGTVSAPSEYIQEWRHSVHFSEAEGYKTTDYTCHVVHSCPRWETNDFRCNKDGEKFGWDYALIECENRWGEYVEVANSVHVDQSVTVHWFHELFGDTRIEDYDSDGNGYCDSLNEPARTRCEHKYWHYSYNPNWISDNDNICDTFGLSHTRGQLCWATRGKSENYHYLHFEEDDEIQLYPLKTPPWAKVTAVSDDQDVLAASTWGCHGMSGSGLFVKEDGEKKLAGISASSTGLLVNNIDLDTTLGTYLCHTADKNDPDENLMGFAGPSVVAHVANQARGHEAVRIIASNSVLLSN